MDLQWDRIYHFVLPLGRHEHRDRPVEFQPRKVSVGPRPGHHGCECDSITNQSLNRAVSMVQGQRPPGAVSSGRLRIGRGPVIQYL